MTDLETYYLSIYPQRTIFAWLHKGREAEAVRREFAFVSSSGQFSRNLRFSNVHEFWNAVRQRIPARIEVGPQFNTLCRPGDEWIGAGKVHNSQEMDRASQQVMPQAWQNKIDAMQQAASVATTSQATSMQIACVNTTQRIIDPNIKHFPIRRELVFDIDLTDYDDVRSCCQGKVVCHKCWILVYAAVLVLEDTLRNKLNLKHILWVYSGRRGVHCWVSDEEAMMLTDMQREYIVNSFLQRPSKFGCHAPDQSSLEHLARAFTVLLPVYEQKWLPAQDGLMYSDFAMFLDPRILSYFPSFAPGQTAQQRYADFMLQLQTFERSAELMSRPGAYSIRDCRLRIVLHTLFPRIDRQVTVKMGHLLKLPFCVHPDTQQLCLPFSPSNYDSIMSVRQSPMLEHLLESYSRWAPPQLMFSESVALLQNHTRDIRRGLSQPEIQTVRQAVMPPKAPTSPVQQMERAFASDGFSLRD